MLIYFKVGNYKSIAKPVVLNFNPSAISEFQESNVINEGKIPLLKTMLLYGHNASGKSKILDAFVYMIWFINSSATNTQSNEPIDVEPFELNESLSRQPSYFEISFIIGKMKYRYGFEADKKSILKEWLMESKAIKDAKEYSVFLRIKQDFQIDLKRFENAEQLEKKARNNALFLSVASQWNVPKAAMIDKWLQRIFTFHGMEDARYRNYTIDFMKDSKSVELISKFMKRADLGISGLEVIEVPVKVEDIIKRAPDKLKNFISEEFKDRVQKTVLTTHEQYNDKN